MGGFGPAKAAGGPAGPQKQLPVAPATRGHGTVIGDDPMTATIVGEKQAQVWRAGPVAGAALCCQHIVFNRQNEK